LILTVQDGGPVGVAKEAVLASDKPGNRLVFEAPQRHQQVHFIRVIGANVNLDMRMNDLASLAIRNVENDHNSDK
jgi:phosphosulfolactate synthase (CoM biosynthesis protein A)